MRALVALVLLTCSVTAHAQVAEVDAARTELRRREAQHATLDQERARLQRRSQELAAEVDREKREPTGVRRDLRLGDLLASAKAESDKLDLVSVELRRQNAVVSDGRRRVISACDRALTADLSPVQRLELARLRTTQVTLLAQPTQASEGRMVRGVEIDPLDGPRELSDKADLLRDSGDKLRREVKRLASRIDDAERRRHLRERASAVDEDLFGDAAYSRRAAQPSRAVATTGGSVERGDAANLAPSTPAVGGAFGGGVSPSAQGTEPTVVLRNLVDPTTLEELRRADSSDDFERQVRALRRAQGELEGLARELDQRAQTLTTKAAALRNQK